MKNKNQRKLMRQCGLVLDLADEEIHTRRRCAKDGHFGEAGLAEVRDLEKDVDQVRPYVLVLPKLLGLLQWASGAWPQFGHDEPVSGGDLVNWFGEWLSDVRSLLAEVTSQSNPAETTGDEELDQVIVHLRHGFVILTHNPTNDSDTGYEAWAYQGNLDFNTASPVRFGLGSDPFEAMVALNDHLSRSVEHKPD